MTTGPVRIAVLAVLYIVVVASFVAAGSLHGRTGTYFLLTYATLVVGAVVVPLVASVLHPRRPAAVMLAAWAVASLGAWIEAAIEDTDRRGAGVVLACALLAAVGLAALLNGRGRPA